MRYAVGDRMAAPLQVCNHGLVEFLGKTCYNLRNGISLFDNRSVNHAGIGSPAQPEPAIRILGAGGFRTVGIRDGQQIPASETTQILKVECRCCGRLRLP